MIPTPTIEMKLALSQEEESQRTVHGGNVRQRPSRQNLTLRMKIARFHCLTLAFSRKLANLKAAEALYFWLYNFCLIHRSLRMTPAMATGITDRIWELDEIL